MLPLAMLLSACGVSLSGEPEIVSEREILAAPTVAQAPTQATTPEPAGAQAVETTEPAAGDTGEIDLASADYDLGFELYLANCAQCHGAQDASQGPSLSNMRDSAATRIEGVAPADYVHQSIVDPGAYVVDGYENIMPASFGEQFSAHELDSLVRFILEFDPASMMGGAAASSEEQATPAPVAVSTGEVLTVRGKLVQGTAGGEVIPPDLDVQLYVLDEQGNLAGTFDTSSAEDNSYTFENIPRAQGYMYLIQTRYQDVPQGTQIHPIQGDESELVQDMTLYERTTDTADIAISWAQMLINFAPIDDFGLEVWLRLELVNNSDRIVTHEKTAGAHDWFVSAALELPVGAFGIQPMQSEDSQRYVVEVVDGVPVVQDTWPLRPGQMHTITVAYYVPYESGAVIDQVMGYPVLDATVLIPNDTVEFSSEQFDPVGEWRGRVSEGGVRITELEAGEQVDPDSDFSLVKAHDLTTATDADGHLVFELIGRPTRTLNVMPPTPGTAASTDDDTNTLPMILGAAGLAVVALAGVLWWRQRGTVQVPVAALGHWTPPDPSAGKEELLRAIATLDDAYEAGHVDDAVYEERRAILTERLLPLLDQDD